MGLLMLEREMTEENQVKIAQMVGGLLRQDEKGHDDNEGHDDDEYHEDDGAYEIDEGHVMIRLMMKLMMKREKIVIMRMIKVTMMKVMNSQE